MSVLPKIHEIAPAEKIPVQKTLLPNGIPLYVLDGIDAEIVRIDLLFRGGFLYQPQPLVARFSARMLREGTAHYTSAQIAELFDSHGARFFAGTGANAHRLSLTTPLKSLDVLLPVLSEMLFCPTFPESEFAVNQQIMKQDWLLQKKKVQTLAMRRFLVALYGKNHPLCFFCTEKMYENLTPDHLRAYFSRRFFSGNCKIVLSGKVRDSLVAKIENAFGRSAWGSFASAEFLLPRRSPSRKKAFFVPKKGALQSAVALGCAAPSAGHADSHVFYVLNMLLGGYFGSRLMANIREKKGYTYGISSSYSTSSEVSSFSVFAQTGVEYTKKLVPEIYKEMSCLSEKPVSFSELNRLKRYMAGDFLRDMDGVFAQADMLNFLLANRLPDDYFDTRWQTIRSVTPQMLQAMAQKYFSPDDMRQVVCG